MLDDGFEGVAALAAVTLYL